MEVMMMSAPNGGESPRVDSTLNPIDVKRQMSEHVETITGEIDRIRIDCELPYLADVISLAANDLCQHVETALTNSVGGANVVPHLLSSLQALANDCARVAGEEASEGYPTNAQWRSLRRFVRRALNGEKPGDRGFRVGRGGMGLPDTYLLVQLADGYTGGIDREGRVST